MKKIYFGIAIILALSATPALGAAKKIVAPPKPAYKAVAPDGYTAITWTKAPGIASFFKAPLDNGAIDFLTRIYLPQNKIDFIASTNPPANQAAITDPGVASPDLSSFPNLSFTRLGAEAAKAVDTSIKFLWDAPFFNLGPVASDLSMAVKYTVGATTTISSGTRSVSDMALPRRMLTIDNKSGKATIADFDPAVFADNKSSDQALEGFAPAVVKTDGPGAGASRLFLGVSNDGQELMVYCSQLATVNEASAALTAAGAPPDHQLEADGGGSAACGYNLPGQFFVEPTRTLPLLMGAKTILLRGKVSGSTLNVRSGPSTKYPILTQLIKGAPIQVFGELNGWYRIGDGQWAIKTLIK